MLYTRQNELDSRRRSCQEKLEEEKSRLVRREDKQRRLKDAYRNMERELTAYVNAVRNLEMASHRTAGSNISAVQKCIRSIERYLRTSL